MVMVGRGGTQLDIPRFLLAWSWEGVKALGNRECGWFSALEAPTGLTSATHKGILGILQGCPWEYSPPFGVAWEGKEEKRRKSLRLARVALGIPWNAGVGVS